MTDALADARKVPRWVWAGLVLLHLAFLCWSLSERSWFFPDSDRYMEAAHNMRAHGMLYARPLGSATPTGQAVQEYTIRPPGYSSLILLLGGAQSAAFPFLLLLLQNTLSGINIGLVLRWWAQRTSPGKREWAAALVLLFFPAQFIYANAVMSELVLQTLILGMAVFGILLWYEPRTRYVVGLVGLAAAAILVKPVFYPFAGVVAILMLGFAKRHRRFLWGVAGMLPVLVTLGYMSWNLQRTGYFHFSSIADINLLHYNAAGVLRQVAGPAAEEQWVAAVLREANSQPDFRLRQQLIQARAGAVLRQYPLVYARQHILGMAAFFLDPGRFDFSRFFQLAEPEGGGLLAQLRAAGLGGLGQVLRRLPLGLLLALALTLAGNTIRVVLAVRGFRLARAAPLRGGRWWLLALMLYVAFLTGPLGAARFLVPVWPLLLLLALNGVKAGVEQQKEAAAGANG